MILLESSTWWCQLRYYQANKVSSESEKKEETANTTEDPAVFLPFPSQARLVEKSDDDDENDEKEKQQQQQQQEKGEREGGAAGANSSLPLPPLVVCISWLVVSPTRDDSIVEKYVNLYSSRNCDVVWMPVWPIHVYLFGELWGFLHDRPEQNAIILANLSGLIADSPIDHVDSARGAASVATGNTTLGQPLRHPLFYWAARVSAWTYLTMTHPITKALHIASAERVRSLSIQAPVLIIFSDDDAVTRADNIRNIVENYYAAAGLDMDIVRFQHSQHARHLDIHPLKYMTHVNKLVDRAEAYWIQKQQQRQDATQGTARL